MPVPTKLRHKKRQSLPSGRVLQLFSNTHLSNCTTSKARGNENRFIFEAPIDIGYCRWTTMNHKTRCTLAIGDSFRSAAVPGFQVEHCASNSRLVENRSDTVGKSS